MTTNDIAAIRKQVPAGYDGPWYVQYREEDGCWLVGYPTDNPKAGLIATVPDYGEQLAEFIAAARTHVPALCDEIEQLRAELAKATDLKERYARTAANLVSQRDNHAAQADRFSAELAKVREQLTAAKVARGEVTPQ